jgi:uncharacterized phage infection (PIP) family protein YhgE
MAVPTLSEAKTFFASDIIIAAMADDRLTYWINDIAAKMIVTEDDFGKLYFNAFMNLLGHYLYFYGNNLVPANGGRINSESVAQVSRSYETYKGDNPMWMVYSSTKYGMMFLSLASQIAVTKGGFVAACGAAI